MARPTDVRPVASQLYFLPVETRVPLKFGTETLTSVTCVRVHVTVENRAGKRATGWGETPLSVQWVWPSSLPYEPRHQRLQDFCRQIAQRFACFEETGHAVEIGHAFQQQVLPELLEAANQGYQPEECMPYLAALVSCSAFDIALHDAFGLSCRQPVYATYHSEFMTDDLSRYLTAAADRDLSFAGSHLQDFLDRPPKRQLPAWHLVGGLDALEPGDLTGDEPQDGYPVLLGDWIRSDELRCLKVKLRGNDSTWDYQRIVRVGSIALAHGVNWLTTDFNCTVTQPEYVNDILDRLMVEHPRIYGMVLYVEQPFPYELEQHRIDVHSTSARKPLFMDESAHDWRLVSLGRELGWTGVALKTCKTQTGTLLALAWARAHGMTLMVQDLTNPMLAQIPHVLLAAHAGTIMGVETNSMQFYPDASRPEAAVHPGLYRRTGGVVSLDTISGPGFGYRLEEIQRELPEPAYRSD